jgi:hypothetical protein
MVFYKGELPALIDPKRFKEAFAKKKRPVFHLQLYPQGHHRGPCLYDTLLIFEFRI